MNESELPTRPCLNDCMVRLPHLNWEKGGNKQKNQAELMADADTGFPYDGAKEHYILDIEHRDKTIEIIETLLPVVPYPKKRR